MIVVRTLIGVLILSATAMCAQYSGGTGESDDPYQIATAEDLMLLGEEPNDYDKHFILTADIDLDPNLPGRRVFDRAVIAPDVNDLTYSWGHNPFNGMPFEGIFDGNCHTISHLTIKGVDYLGLFGELDSGARISNLGLDAADVNGTGRYVGCLGGWNDGSITTCYSTGSVSGDWGGGLVGMNDGIITNCYSTGAVNGDEYVGGLVGKNWNTITSSYSIAVVNGNGVVGGLVGVNTGSITMSIWDMETSGLTVSQGGVGLTTAEMMDPYMLGLNGFANDPNWILDAGRDYPRLAWEGTAGQIIPEPEPIIDWLDGQGTEQEPYRIDRADQLILLTRASTLWDKHFILCADIDLDPNLPGRQVFSQAVMQVFSGVFAGNDHTISHLTIRGGCYMGLFGRLGPEAKISNLGLDAADIGTSYDGGSYVGCLGGWNDGSITNCYSTGTVRSGGWRVGGPVGMGSGGWRVGGLVGCNEASITSCYSTCSVSGYGTVGGLAGSNAGSISNSYSMGMAAANGFHGTKIGGLVGWNDGSITNSYSTGIVIGSEDAIGGLVGGNDGSITSSFWDVQTSGFINMCGGQDDDAIGCDDSFGKTTTKMQTASTFLDADWDFVDETENGTDDIWWIVEGRDYPRLWWEKLYVDDDAPDDPGPGNPQIGDPLEGGRQTHPFDSIQEAIDVAPDESTILVRPGVYDKINFFGKAITVAGIKGAAVIEASPNNLTDSLEQDAVTFHTGEGPEAVLKNFIIRNSGIAISLNYGSSPSLYNLTIVDNDFGIAAYENSNPDIRNCILWNNINGDLFQCEARYSCIENIILGEGNISVNPLFVDAANGDYHLKSEGWRWNSIGQSWTWDEVTSPCIDAGDPSSPLGDEPMRVPRDPDNLYGINRRINMGAYGGTSQASMPPLDWLLPDDIIASELNTASD